LTRQYSRGRRDAIGHLTGLVSESLQGIRTVHAFASQDVHDRYFDARNSDVLRLGLRKVEVSARLTPVLDLVGALGTALLLFVGGYGALHNWWSVGVLVVVTTYLKNIFSPMKTLAKLAPSFAQGAASAERIAAILDQPTDHMGTSERLPDRVRGHVELREVGLDYGRGPVFLGISHIVQPGERIALLGDNGAGKSTLLSLIGGCTDPPTDRSCSTGTRCPTHRNNGCTSR
jgi:ATP-binding cassette subfamily B protein/subfamily B ATP-binding cassette protein MsbA